MSRYKTELENLKREIPELQVEKVLTLGPNGAAGMLAFMLITNASKAHREDVAMTVESLKSHVQALVAAVGDNYEATDSIAAALTVILGDQVKKLNGNSKKMAAVTSGLKRINDQRTSSILEVREIANQLWAEDEDKLIRTTEMTEIIWAKLVDEGRVELLPEDKERLKIWIRPVAPPHARLGGRAKKNTAERNGK